MPTRGKIIVKMAVCAAMCLPFAVHRAQGQSVAQTYPGELNDMPAIPQTYQVPDWNQIAGGFYQLALNPTASGSYLPLMQVVDNVSGQPVEFGLPAYVQSSGT